MKFAGYIKNDTAAAPGLCVSFFVQGCSRRCKNCHNPQTWDHYGGYDFTPETLKEIMNAISHNGIQRNFCVMGGEPLEDHNMFLTRMVVEEVRKRYPEIKIYVWTGFTMEELSKKTNPHFKSIIPLIDVIIDGPYVDSLRDTNLEMRGSSNQKIWVFDNKNNFWYNKENENEVYEL